MSEIKLLPCPFCGGEAIFEMNIPIHKVLNRIVCTQCGVNTGLHHTTESGVAKKWNTRKPMQDIVERLEEEKAKKYKDWNKTSHFQDLGGYRECEHIIEIVKEVGGMNG